MDITKGTASVGENYRNKLFKKYDWVGTVKGDIVLASSIIYKNKSYPVTSIGANAFMSCDKLNSVTIPNSVCEVKYSSFSAFNLKQIIVSPDNNYFKSVEGVLFSKDMSRIYHYPRGRDETMYIIPQSVISIEADAFSYCPKLKNITIPENVKYIKSEAFEYGKFQSIIIPDKVIEIGDKAFQWCTELTSIKLPISVSKLGNEVFYYCHDLSSVIYQNKDLVFSSDAFKDCKKLNANNIVYEVPKSLFLELAQKGNSQDQYKLAICYLNGDGFPKDYKLAREWFEKAAKSNSGLVQKALGDIYIKGVGVDKNLNEAIKWYLLAANNGNAYAQSFLGDCYFDAIGVNIDLLKAIKFYKLAAAQGDVNAQKKLAYCYYNGKGGVDIDYNEAGKWYWEAGNKGDAESSYYVALLCYEGKGVKKDDIKALNWSDKAVNGGIEEAQWLYCRLAYDDAVKSMNSHYYSSAISRFTSLLKYDIKNVDAYINRGFCYLNLQVKDYSNAEKDFKKALELDSDNQIAKNNLQIVNGYYKRINDAKSFCDKGDQYYNQKDYNNAVANYAKSISLDNTKAYPYYSIGYCFFDCQQYTDAINYFDQAIAINPNYTDAIKARKNAKTIIICNAISQAATTMLNSLSAIYNNSANYATSPSYSSSSSVPASSNASYNAYLNNEADKAVNREKKNSKDNYDMYMRLYDRERAEADSYYRQYNIHGDVDDLRKSKDCEARAKDYLEKANIWK